MRSQIFKKEGARNDDPLRHLKHFLCQDDAEILELGSGFTIKYIYDSIKLLKGIKIDRVVRPIETCKISLHRAHFS